LLPPNSQEGNRLEEKRPGRKNPEKETTGDPLKALPPKNSKKGAKPRKKTRDTEKSAQKKKSEVPPQEGGNLARKKRSRR